MKFKKILLTLGAVFAFSLAACNNNASDSGKTDPTPSGGGSQTETDPTYLGFVGKDKIRIDIMNEGLVGKFTYGNAVLEASNNKKDIAYSSSTKLAKRDGITATSVNFIVVIDKEGQDSVAYHPEIETDKLEEFLSDVMVLSGGKRVYVAISTGAVTWTKGLNADMDAKIETYTLVPRV